MRPKAKTQTAPRSSMQRLVNLLPPQRDKVYAYKMGYDCGQNGSNLTNCSFSIFSSKENTAEWERGHRDGKHQVNDQAQRPPTKTV